MANISNLIEFIEVANKNRIYPRGTADGYKAAVKLFDAELSEEERESLNIFLERIDKIYPEVVRKNQGKIKIQSLETYKVRVKKVISDFVKYGQDPSKLASWNRPGRKSRQSGTQKTIVPNDATETTNDLPLMAPSFTQMNRIELSLRPESDIKALVIVPFDLKSDEATKIKGLVDALVQN
jgi:hypothetical protein